MALPPGTPVSPRAVIVFCTDDSDYLGWQAAVAAHAAAPLGLRMLVTAHGGRSAGHVLAARHATVVDLPAAHTTPAGVSYPPRHLPASLFHAAGLVRPDDVVVLADADTLFLSAHDFRPWTGGPCGYLDHVPAGGRVQTPWCVPGWAAAALAGQWLAHLDRRLAAGGHSWVAVQEALADAAAGLGVHFAPTVPQATNHADDAPAAATVHYCFGSPAWNKREYTAGAAGRVWATTPTGTPGTVLHAVTSAVAAAATAYGVAPRPVPGTGRNGASP